jgi:hypothetical protein
MHRPDLLDQNICTPLYYGPVFGMIIQTQGSGGSWVIIQTHGKSLD